MKKRPHQNVGIYCAPSAKLAQPPERSDLFIERCIKISAREIKLTASYYTTEEELDEEVASSCKHWRLLTISSGTAKNFVGMVLSCESNTIYKYHKNI